MRGVLFAIVISSLFIGVSACALEAPEDEGLDEVSAASTDLDSDVELATFAAAPEDQELDSLEGEEEPPGGPTTNTTYYDGCKTEHQACHCQNTGWAGWCKWTIFWPNELVLRCYCG